MLAAQSTEGRPIVSVSFEPASQPLTQGELTTLLPFKVGDPLTRESVRAAIHALFATGRYEDVAIDAKELGPGVALTIKTEFAYFSGGVVIEGDKEPPSPSQLSSATKLELGAPLTPEVLQQARDNLEERLRANGLYEAKVADIVERDPATGDATITFRIQPGIRARFAGLTTTGDGAGSETETMEHQTGWRRGFLFLTFPGWREMTEARVQSGLQKIRQGFQQGNHLQARVTLDDLNYDAALHTVTPRLRIDKGPVTEIRTSGEKVSRGRLRQLIPIFEERSVDRGLLIEGRRNLVEYFQSHGYFEASVEFQQLDTQPGVTLIDYRVNKGDRHKLVNVRVSGNYYFDSSTIRERMFIAPASLLRYRNGRFSQKILEQDKESIRGLYRSNGFRDAVVNSLVEDDYQGQKGNLSVTLNIEEGRQWFVNRLTLEGVPAGDEAYLRAQLRSVEDQAFSEANVAADRDVLLTHYFDNGYPDASFDWAQAPENPDNPGDTRVNLQFKITPGKQIFVRNILVHGLETTRANLVQSRIRLNRSGPISRNQIVDSQLQLYDLGIFSKVQTAIQNPDGKEETKNVLFLLDEARKYSFTAGVGAEIARIGGGVTTFDAPAGEAGFSPRISLGLTRINFKGLGHTVGIQTLTSTLRQRALLSYVAPQFTGNQKLSLTFSSLFDHSRDVRTFVARHWEGSIQLGERISRDRTVQFRYTFRLVTIDPNSLKIDPLLIPLLSQPVKVGQIGAAFIQDRRDDPVNSRRGNYTSADVSVAMGALGSEADYTRLLFRNSSYHLLGRELVLARSLQFGYVQRLGGLPQIPLAERFFSGGASTHRAFPDNQAGPRDLSTGFPLGGNALLFHSLELRFPLIGDNVGGVLFHDMGNVYSDITKITLRSTQHGLTDFDYMVHSVGMGIRYRTPVGPIRVDLSLSPNSPRFYGFAGTRDELLMGQGTLVNQRINVFQFHFSLGQTF